MKKQNILLIAAFVIISCFVINNLAFAGETFKNYTIKANEALAKFAKANLEDASYLPEVLAFNNVYPTADVDINKAEFKDIGYSDNDTLLIPPMEALKAIRKAKTDAEKKELVMKFKKINIRDVHFKISILREKLGEGEINGAKKIENKAQDK